LGELSYDLTSENVELLASLASVLENLSTPLGFFFQKSYFQSAQQGAALNTAINQGPIKPGSKGLKCDAVDSHLDYRRW
jgi:hypothetical protein